MKFNFALRVYLQHSHWFPHSLSTNIQAPPRPLSWTFTVFHIQQDFMSIFDRTLSSTLTIYKGSSSSLLLPRFPSTTPSTTTLTSTSTSPSTLSLTILHQSIVKTIQRATCSHTVVAAHIFQIIHSRYAFPSSLSIHDSCLISLPQTKLTGHT